MAEKQAGKAQAHTVPPQGGQYVYTALSDDERLDSVRRAIKNLETEHYSYTLELTLCEHDCHVIHRQSADGLNVLVKDLDTVQRARTQRRETLRAELRRLEASLGLLHAAYDAVLAEAGESAAAPAADSETGQEPVTVAQVP